jgi:hypothetical protein
MQPNIIDYVCPELTKVSLVEMRKLSSNQFEDPKGSFRAFLNSFFYRQVRIVQGERHRLKLETSCTSFTRWKTLSTRNRQTKRRWEETEWQRFKETGTQTYFVHSSKTETKSHNKNEFAAIQWHVLCDANSKKK